VSVGVEDIKVPRRLWRNARAAAHKGRQSDARGLREWCHPPYWRCPICWLKITWFGHFKHHVLAVHKLSGVEKMKAWRYGDVVRELRASQCANLL
jgi:hypothetical protein